ncbi:MAG: insulinase family protein [Treponema sp.]|nr:insulinase family protein [Treponema sp.]
MMKKDSVYKGFRVLDVVDVEDCSSKGIYLVHEKTGMEVFHLLNDDEENLFAFSFKTPTLDSSGVAHVLEHSVLCGSEKYPIRDPFIRMANQSVSTYLNAFTAPDSTVFPASSTIREDYFNLFSVYADAVFFPLLRPEIFLQECHRVEYDEKGNPSIQGVVYNEMKGAYSSFDTVVSSSLYSAILAGTQYAFKSGGDPMEIPNLTLKKLKAYHKKYYCAANCHLFLYGNVPTEDQLDFLDKNVLSKIKDPGKKAAYPKPDKSCVIEPNVHSYGPVTDDEKNSNVDCVWKIDVKKNKRPDQTMELLFLETLLMEGDSSVLNKRLFASGLGKDISSETGGSYSLQYPVMTCGLRGVELKNVKKVKKEIYSILESICRDGIDKADLDRVCMEFEFSNREIVRGGGPYSLVLMRRCMRGWRYGCKPWETLLMNSSFARLKQKIEANPGYISEMIHRYLLDNENCSLVTVTPSVKWMRDRAKMEKANVESAVNKLGEKKIRALVDSMYAFQNAELSPEEENLLPRIRVKDLKGGAEILKTVKSSVNGITLFSCEQPTNGILYFNVAFPVDTLHPKDYAYIPMISAWLTQVGWGEMSWSRALCVSQGIAGNMGSSLFSTDKVDWISEKNPAKDYNGRDWMIVQVSVLREKIPEGLDMLAKCISTVDFSDEERLKELVRADFSAMKASVVPSANHYAAMRAQSRLSRSYAIQELWHGLSMLETIKKLNDLPTKDFSQMLKKLLKKITSSGAILQMTGDKECLQDAKKLIPDLITKLSLIPPKKAYPSIDEDFFKLIELDGEVVQRPNRKKFNPSFVDELILVNGTVGYACASMRSSGLETRDCVADMVFCHYAENNDFWKSVRTIGGAYGVTLFEDALDKYMVFLTYRDPKPFASLESLFDILKDMADKKFSPEDIEKAVTGCYSEEVPPRTPYQKGKVAFYRELIGINPHMMERRVRWLLSITPAEIQKAAKRYYESSISTNERYKRVIICGKEMFLPKNKENSGKIIKISV